MTETKKDASAPAPDTWTKWVALSTTLLAVCAAFATLKGGSFSTKTQLATVSASNKWSYFQSKSLKETARDTESTIIKVIEASATSPEAKAIARKAIEKADDEIKRYKTEKAEIMKEAQFLDAEAAYSQARGGNFGLAIMFLQIAIMLSAISALMKKKSFLKKPKLRKLMMK
jgi:capsular polysaccharide biosynthesis protein